MSDISKRCKHTFVFGVKICIAAGLIYWLVRSDRLDFSSMARIDLNAANLQWIVLGALCVLVGQALMAVRLQLLLGCFKLHPSFSRVFGLTLIGSFCSVLLPGLVGGDAVRAVYLFRDAPGRRSQPTAAVIIDRVIGLYSLFLLGSLALAVARMNGMLKIWNPVLLIGPAIVLGMTLAVPVLAWDKLQHWPLFAWMLRRMPGKIRNLLLAMQVCLKRPGILLWAIGLSVANHALVISTFAVAGVLLGETIAPITHFVLSPLATVLNAAALTPGGIGLTEGAFSFLYQNVGIASGATIGLLGRFIQYVTFLLAGSLAFLFVRMRAEPVPKMTAEKAA
jgi:glycosyltransferase 2 family protein